MDTLILSRIQFALTTGFHFIFAPLSIGLAWLVFFLVTKHLRSNDKFHDKTARFWVKMLTLSFLFGVVTGIPLEFQFGTNWSEYSKFVGDLFGAPLATEVITSFFLESLFIAVLIYGWGRLSKKVIWFSSLVVAIAATLSGFWIITANSWMQTPAGHVMVNGMPKFDKFWSFIFNPSTLPRFLHTIDGALMTGSFMMLGIGAWFLLKRKNERFGKSIFKTALIVGALTSILQLFLGHYHAIQVAKTQPEKLATIEGVYKTQTKAPALLFGIPGADEIKYAVKVPGLLSLMAFGDINAKVTGMNEFAKEDLPPVALTFTSFHLMVAVGMAMIGVTLLGLLLMKKNKLWDNRLFLKLAFLSIPLPFIGNELGWITAEVGRQP